MPDHLDADDRKAGGGAEILVDRAPFDKAEPGASLAEAIDAWCRFAKVQQQLRSGGLPEAVRLGQAWAQWGRALRELLKSQYGGGDGAALDAIICRHLAEQGFSVD